MPVDTKKVTDRRTVRYATVDDLLQDAERIAKGPHRALGNWSAGQVFTHLAIVFGLAVDGNFPLKPPWFIRLGARLFKRRILRKGLPPGFQLPKGAESMIPGETSADEGLELLRRALARWKSEPQRAANPLLGKLTHEEYDQFQLRHAETHMSFLVPA